MTADRPVTFRNRIALLPGTVLRDYVPVSAREEGVGELTQAQYERRRIVAMSIPMTRWTTGLGARVHAGGAAEGLAPVIFLGFILFASMHYVSVNRMGVMELSIFIEGERER